MSTELRIESPYTLSLYGLRVRTIGPFSLISSLPADTVEAPVRNPLFHRSPAASDDPHAAANCGFHMASD